MSKFIFVNRYFAPDNSATSQILTDLACALASQGDEVHVVTSRQRIDEPNASLAPSEFYEGVRIHRVWTSSFGRRRLVGRALDYCSFYGSAFVSLVRLVQRGDVVVAKTDPPLISVFVAAVARLRNAYLVNWLQDLFPEVAAALGVQLAKGWLGACLTIARDWSLSCAAVNVAIGSRMADRVIDRGVVVDSVVVIPNWSDGDAIRPISPSKNLLRKVWNLEDKFVVGYSGNLGRAHELKMILAVANELRDDLNIVFLIIGSGYQLETIREEAVRRQLFNVMFQPLQRREILGQSLTVPDVHFVSLRAELEGLVVPSKFYGIAAAGRPSIFIGASDGEIALLLEREACGWVVAPGDVVRTAKMLREWAADPSIPRAMGASARVLFEARFDRRIAIAVWIELLHSVRARSSISMG